MNPKIMFWMCLILALLNLAAAGFLAYNGVRSFASLGFGAYWIFLAWLHARRIPQ